MNTRIFSKVLGPCTQKDKIFNSWRFTLKGGHKQLKTVFLMRSSIRSRIQSLNPSKYTPLNGHIPIGLVKHLYRSSTPIEELDLKVLNGLIGSALLMERQIRPR